MSLNREDDFTERRQQLADLSQDELEERFWQLSEEIVTPLIELAETHTSPSIERSVLLRMGFDSLEARSIVNKVMEAGLLGKGAGHVVLKLANRKDLEIISAGRAIGEEDYTSSELQELFAGGED